MHAREWRKLAMPPEPRLRYWWLDEERVRHVGCVVAYVQKVERRVGRAVVEGTFQGGDLYIDIGVPVGLPCQQLQETSWWDRNDRGSARLS